MNVLVTVASEHGATRGIGEAIADVLRQRGCRAAVEAPDGVRDVSGYDAFVVGSAIYGGHWLPPALAFVDRFSSQLSSCPVWLFSSGPVGNPERRLVQKMTADPLDVPHLLSLTHAREHRLLSGKLDGGDLQGGRRLSLLVFRGIAGDWRDWDAIAGWAHLIADDLAPVSPAASIDAHGGER